MDIKRRTVFVVDGSGQRVPRFFSWAELVTSSGTFLEPFTPDLRLQQTDVDARIDEVKKLTRNQVVQLFPVHGGALVPEAAT